MGPYDRIRQSSAVADRLVASKIVRSSARAHEPDGPDAALVAALCGGSEAAFTLLVDQHHEAMVRVASLFVCGRAAAEDVVQDVWMIVVGQITTFQGRCSLKTWIFRILTNRAKTAGQRDARNTPMSMMPGLDWGGREPASRPDDSILMEEAMAVVRDAICDLPRNQRQVITLRDVDGYGAAEVCERLELTEGNQRVLLHRARSQVRTRVLDYDDHVMSADAQ